MGRGPAGRVSADQRGPRNGEIHDDPGAEVLEIDAWFRTGSIRSTDAGAVWTVPGHGSAEVRVESALPAPYGFVLAQAIQISDMSPHDTWTSDPPLDACAFRLVNTNLAPPGYGRAIDRSSGCVGW